MKKHNPRTLITLIRQYYTFYYQQKNVCEKTRANHRIRINQIFRYLDEIRKPQIEIQDINIDFVTGFMKWSNQIFQQTNTSRNVELLKNVIDFSISKKLLTINVISQIITSRSPLKEVIELDDNELLRLFNYKGDALENKSVVNYIFQSETGISYGDRESFQIRSIDGIECICGRRKKGIMGNHKEYWVPLSERAKKILKNGKLPQISNIAYNRSLQDIARKIGISKHITTHTARKTFATRMYNKGYSREAIADMMGIDLVTLKHYIKQSNKRILAEHLKITSK